ncbi:hypothetical protein AWENTII_004348 [Aspergillus wentii]
MPPQTRQVVQQRGSVEKEKRKPVRRDPERRRQQNIQAQRKYREKRRERLDHLEALAAQSCAVERTSAAGTGLYEDVAKNPPSYDSSDVSASTSTATLGECQHLIPQLDDTPSAHIWDPTDFSQLDDTPSSLSIYDSTTHVDPSLLTRGGYVSLDLFCTTTIDCGCSSPHIKTWTQAPDPFSHGEVRIFRFGSNTATADPYSNNLRIETICIAAALHTLGMHVGITEEMLCADESPSPFFRPTTNDIVKSNMINTVQRIFKTLKPDMRPSSEQITVQHHPYIDILPFPTLRKNLIIHQEDFDEDEFFLDMLNGLVCWGGAGVGRRDREEATGYVSTGTPWDVRSWEARGWFLKKYWMLLGGEEGELVRQSEWWRGMRGDDLEV